MIKECTQGVIKTKVIFRPVKEGYHPENLINLVHSLKLVRKKFTLERILRRLNKCLLRKLIIRLRHVLRLLLLWIRLFKGEIIKICKCIIRLLPF
jgi:hypothetical protein